MYMLCDITYLLHSEGYVQNTAGFDKEKTLKVLDVNTS